MRFAGVIALLVLSPLPVEADVLRRALDAGDGGGSTPPPPTPSSAANDLASWAGQSTATTLPALLQIAVRQAPALASARFDIAVADAQISETWARNDWRVQAQKLGFRTDFFNAFNIASYGQPDTSINDSNFGQITNTRSPQRQIQFSLHYMF